MWDVLGIPETGDAKAIRRAYAARLRMLDPDKDPRGFQVLREAYDRAIARANNMARRARPQGEARQQTPSRQPESAQNGEAPPPSADAVATQQNAPVAGPAPIATPVTLPPEIVAAREREVEAKAQIKAIVSKAGVADYEAAFAALDHGLAQGLFPLGARDAIVERIMARVVPDLSLSGERYVAYAERVGWNVPPGRREFVTQTRQASQARWQAEQWFARMKALAEARDVPVKTLRKQNWIARRLRWRLERRNARLFFGAWMLPRSSKPGVADLRKKLQELQLYKPWLGDRISPVAIKRAERVAQISDLWRSIVNIVVFVVGILFALGFCVAMVASGLTPAALLPVFIAFRFGRAYYKRMMARI